MASNSVGISIPAWTSERLLAVFESLGLSVAVSIIDSSEVLETTVSGSDYGGGAVKTLQGYWPWLLVVLVAT